MFKVVTAAGRHKGLMGMPRLCAGNQAGSPIGFPGSVLFDWAGFLVFVGSKLVT